MSDGEKQNNAALARTVEHLEERLSKFEDNYARDKDRLHATLSNIEKDVVKTETVLTNLNKSVQELVTRGEFTPVKLIVFGLAGTILSSAVASLMAGVLK